MWLGWLVEPLAVNGRKWIVVVHMICDCNEPLHCITIRPFFSDPLFVCFNDLGRHQQKEKWIVAINVLQRASSLYCSAFTAPEQWGKGGTFSTSPICIAVHLPCVSHYASHLYCNVIGKLLVVGVTGMFPPRGDLAWFSCLVTKLRLGHRCKKTLLPAFGTPFGLSLRTLFGMLRDIMSDANGVFRFRQRRYSDNMSASRNKGVVQHLWFHRFSPFSHVPLAGQWNDLGARRCFQLIFCCAWSLFRQCWAPPSLGTAPKIQNVFWWVADICLWWCCINKIQSATKTNVMEHTMCFGFVDLKVCCVVYASETCQGLIAVVVRERSHVSSFQETNQWEGPQFQIGIHCWETKDNVS